MKQTSKEGLGIVGIGAAACVACCLGPLLALLGGVTLAGLASAFLIGTVGLLVAAASFAALLIVRRRRNTCPETDAVSIPVADPTVRSHNTARSAK